jgi:hypothetical protein
MKESGQWGRRSQFKMERMLGELQNRVWYDGDEKNPFFRQKSNPGRPARGQ